MFLVSYDRYEAQGLGFVFLSMRLSADAAMGAFMGIRGDGVLSM
jgi:hypothetical protein